MNLASYPLWALLAYRIQEMIKGWLKPTTVSLAIGAITDLSRSRANLMVENALLRQQLIVLNRQIKRPQLTNGDRIRLLLLARCTKFWHQALHIIQPDTLLRWHRDLFRLYWRHISNSDKKKQRIASETIQIIRKMIQENKLWGSERIRGELLKLCITLSKRTIQKYIRLVRKSPSFTHNWAAFIKNHIGDIWACDFTVVYDWLFHPIYIFVIMELKKRRIIHIGVTESPIDEWTSQQLREATPCGEHPKYLIRDRDKKFGFQFSALAKHSGIEVIQTSFRTPQANAFCERFMGSLKRECLDQSLVLHQRHLKRLVTEYSAYFNEERPHQGINQCISNRSDSLPIKGSGYIRSVAFLGGLHHSYSRVSGPLQANFPGGLSKVASTAS
jgi:transposase InsO family protein